MNGKQALSALCACAALSLVSCGTVLPIVGRTFGIAAIGSGKADSLPPVFKETSLPNVDPEITIERIKADLGKYYEIYKLVIYGDDASYEIRRNDFGTVVDKISRREVWIAYKDLKDGKYYYNSIRYIRDFDGVAFGAPRANFAVPTETDEGAAKD
jgi:hypothetical protein